MSAPSGQTAPGTLGSFVDLVLPPLDAIVESVPADLMESEADLRARVRLSLLNAHVRAGARDLEAAIDDLRIRAGGHGAGSPSGAGPRAGGRAAVWSTSQPDAETFEALAALADRAHADDRLDLPTVIDLLFQSGSIAARRGRRLLVFLGLMAHVRRRIWDYGTEQIRVLGLGDARVIELGTWLLLSTELSALAVSEGYRATERELLARDASARRAAVDELLSAQPTTARAALRLRRLAARYGLDPDATYRVATIVPGAASDPTPESPGIDEADLQLLAERLDHLVQRRHSRSETAAGIRVPLVVTWRGSMVAILGAGEAEWTRLQAAVRSVLGPDGAAWTVIAMPAAGVTDLARALGELGEGARVASEIGRHGVIDDLAELAMERLLLSDPDLARVLVDRELGPLLADRRMGGELIETLQTYFDSGFNRRETARRLHLADRTVAYRLDRIEQLLGHGLEGEAGRRLEVALTLNRLGRPG